MFNNFFQSDFFKPARAVFKGIKRPGQNASETDKPKASASSASKKKSENVGKTTREAHRAIRKTAREAHKVVRETHRTTREAKRAERKEEREAHKEAQKAARETHRVARKEAREAHRVARKASTSTVVEGEQAVAKLTTSSKAKPKQKESPKLKDPFAPEKFARATAKKGKAIDHTHEWSGKLLPDLKDPFKGKEKKEQKPDEAMAELLHSKSTELAEFAKEHDNYGGNWRKWNKDFAKAMGIDGNPKKFIEDMQGLFRDRLGLEGDRLSTPDGMIGNYTVTALSIFLGQDLSIDGDITIDRNAKLATAYENYEPVPKLEVELPGLDDGKTKLASTSIPDLKDPFAEYDAGKAKEDTDTKEA